MAVIIRLGGVDISADLPLYSHASQVIRPNDQAEGYIKYTITLSGFLESHAGHEAVQQLFLLLQAKVGKNRTHFTYIDGSTTLHNQRPVFIDSYNEPTDTEYAKQEIGDYSITLYYFGDATNTDPSGLSVITTCTYGGYTFEKVPNWGRNFQIPRPHYRSPLTADTGKVAIVTLSGVLFSTAGSADLQGKIDALQAAFNEDRTLTYGTFSQSMRTGGCEVSELFPLNYAPYKITLYYDVGTIFSLRRRVRHSRLHLNPKIEEEPGCDRRQIELMNSSGQTISYSFFVEAPTIEQATEILQLEASAIVEPGGVEMPGGDEEWDLDTPSVSLSFTKFYNTPVIGNLTGT